MSDKRLAWHQCIESLSRFVVKIHTPSGWGTGFLFYRSQGSGLVGIATAKHVVEHAKTWNQPIRLQHAGSSESIFLKDESRAILLNSRRDIASIVVNEKLVNFAAGLPEFLEKGKRKKDGVELGWLGYPSVAPSALCFFSGRISSYLEEEMAYLIDGVAINGASGGPVFDEYEELTGLVTAYIPNVSTAGQTLPGLCLVYNVAPLRAVIEDLDSLDEAKEEEQKEAPAEVEGVKKGDGAAPKTAKGAGPVGVS